MIPDITVHNADVARFLLGEDPQSPRYLQTVWGFGYVFIPDGTPHR